MFIGHYAVALAAKRLAPRTSLGTLFAAAQLLDLAWPVLVLAGVEEVRIAPGDTAFTPLEFVSYPISHSAAAVALWSALFGAVYLVRTRYRTGAWVTGALVASHWLLDAVAHRPDLPLWPGGPKVGLGLWGSVPATLALEAAAFAAGAWLYLSATIPRDRVGRWALAALLGFLGATYAATAMGPPPPSVPALAATSLLLWLLIPWAAWADRHRDPIPGRAAPTAARA
jgi:hypothetical protein